MGDQTLGLILHIQPPQLSKNFTWSAATSSNVIEHIVCFIQDENTLLINSAELCTSACWVSWGFSWPSAQLCQVSRCTLKLCYSVCQLLFLVNMISKFAGSSFCLTVKVEDENTKQHKTPYWLPDAQLITGQQLNMKPLIPTLSAHLPGQFWIYLFSAYFVSSQKTLLQETVSKTLLMLSTVTLSTISSTTGPCSQLFCHRRRSSWSRIIHLW